MIKFTDKYMLLDMFHDVCGSVWAKLSSELFWKVYKTSFWSTKSHVSKSGQSCLSNNMSFFFSILFFPKIFIRIHNKIFLQFSSGYAMKYNILLTQVTKTEKKRVFAMFYHQLSNSIYCVGCHNKL